MYDAAVYLWASRGYSQGLKSFSNAKHCIAYVFCACDILQMMYSGCFLLSKKQWRHNRSLDHSPVMNNWLTVSGLFYWFPMPYAMF